MSNQYKNQKEKWIREGYENAKLDLKMNNKNNDNTRIYWAIIVLLISSLLIMFIQSENKESYLKENNHIIPKGNEAIWTSFEDNETIIVLDSNDEMNKQIITQLNQYLQYKATK